MKKKSKRKPKSRIKYEKNNPVFSIRMPLEWHKEYNELIEKLNFSRREFMGISLDKQKADYDTVCKQAHEEGHQEGYQKGLEEGKKIGEKKDLLIVVYMDLKRGIQLNKTYVLKHGLVG